MPDRFLNDVELESDAAARYYRENPNKRKAMSWPQNGPNKVQSGWTREEHQRFLEALLPDLEQ